MGLSIAVGRIAELSDDEPERADQIRADLELINEELQRRGLAEHVEPDSFDQPLETRASMTSFPYSWLHYLRRMAAHIIRDPKWIPYPLEPGEDPADDPVLRQMYQKMSSHLLCHSDSEGYYVPVDFEELLVGSEEEMPGMVVGSSYQLRRELLQLVETLEIEVDKAGNISDTEAHRVSMQRPSGTPFAIERLVWLGLYEACRLSIDHGTAVVFE